MLKSIQYELWAECNVGCRYCYLLDRIKHTPEEEKLKGIKRARDWLEAGNYEDYDIIAFIGGEFLQGQLNTKKLEQEFFDLIDLAVDVIQRGFLKGIWVSASMTHKTKHLDWMMRTLNQLKSPGTPNGGWLITSYDNKYRFNEKTLQTWKENMLLKKEKYPNVKVNTCSILTQNLIEEYLSSDYRFQDFINDYDTSIYIKPPYLTRFGTKKEQERIMPGFFPKRKDFLKFMAKVYSTEETYIFDKICNIKFRADTLYRSTTDQPEFRRKNQKCEIITEKNLPCGHQRPYAAYIDSDGCMLCDKHRLAF